MSPGIGPQKQAICLSLSHPLPLQIVLHDLRTIGVRRIRSQSPLIPEQPTGMEGAIPVLAGAPSQHLRRAGCLLRPSQGPRWQSPAHACQDLSKVMPLLHMLLWQTGLSQVSPAGIHMAI